MEAICACPGNAPRACFVDAVSLYGAPMIIIVHNGCTVNRHLSGHGNKAAIAERGSAGSIIIREIG